MKSKVQPKSRFARLLAALLLLAAAASGCKTASFYAQAIKGQYQILARARPVKKLLADPETPAALREKLRLLDELRAYAEKNLELPTDGHYQKYADLGRPFVVWNVEAAPEFSMAPRTWWYPLVGSLKYRGYFSQPAATNYARWVRKQGYDVFVGGVSAYSTLGWFKDPALNTFLFDPPPDLAETLFHELAHQRVFAAGDTDFNEAFATTVGQEGARRWLKAKGDQATLDNYQAHLRRTDQFAHLVMRARLQLEALYGDERTEAGKVKAGPKPLKAAAERMREQKREIMAQLRQDYAGLKGQWGGDTEYDGWFGRELNNAQLNSVAAYYDLVPDFERLLELNGGDFGKFYTAVERLSKLPKKARRQALKAEAAQPARERAPAG